MTNAIQQAYASNSETPLLTVEFINTALDGGTLRLVESNYDLTATTEDDEEVTFSRAGINIDLPEKNTDGNQSITISIDNTNNLVWQEIKKVVAANRISRQPIKCKFRAFLESDLSAPAENPYVFTVTSSSINRSVASITAAYTPIPDTFYPRYKYYPTIFKGVKYV